MALEKKVFEALWSFGEYKFALYRYLLSPILVFVKTYLPSVSALNAIVTASKVHRDSSASSSAHGDAYQTFPDALKKSNISVVSFLHKYNCMFCFNSFFDFTNGLQ